jgi:hypothetical protein
MTADQLIRILEKLPDDQKELPVVMSCGRDTHQIFGVGIVKDSFILLDDMDRT